MTAGDLPTFRSPCIHLKVSPKWPDVSASGIGLSFPAVGIGLGQSEVGKHSESKLLGHRI
jgi:hypothetical protein